METRRRGSKGGCFYGSQEVRRSFNVKQSRGCRSWQPEPTVPSWEKTFCKVVGTLDWETIVNTKKSAHLYENVLKWDDFAGKVAFHTAKNQFFASMNGLSCDLSLPDQDLYIDKVDWDTKVDPEKTLSDRFMDPLDIRDGVIIFGEEFWRSKGFSSRGWSECDEEDLKKNVNPPSNINHDNPCVGDSGWGATGWTNSWSWNNQPEDQNVKSKNLSGTEDGGSWGTRDVIGNKNNCNKRYGTSRFHGNWQQVRC